MSPRQTTGAFHIQTRRRTAWHPTPPPSIPTSFSPPQAESPLPTTPEQPTKPDRGNSSSLSSVPSSLGSTPDGLRAMKPRSSKRQIRHESPVRKASSKRKARTETEIEADKSHFVTQQPSTRSLKRQKTAPKAESHLPTPSMRRPSRTVNRKSNEELKQQATPPQELSRKHKRSDNGNGNASENPIPSLSDGGNSPRREAKPKVHLSEALQTARSVSAKKPEPKEALLKSDDKGNEDEDFDFQKHKGETLWLEFKPNRPIYYGTDAQTRYTASSHRGNSATGSPRRNGRGGGGGRGRGGGLSNGIGRGKGRPRGGGRTGRGGGGAGGSDSPERKRTLSPGAKESLMILKKRQQELKIFFKVVGIQQYEVLDQLAARDLTKLMRKPKTHQQVPEYNDVFEDLVEGMKDAIFLAQKKKEIQVINEEERFQREKEMIETKFKTHMENIKQEYLRGVQGDLILNEESRKASEDETRTEAGSEINYFPQYHLIPDPTQTLRGYNSTHIRDEKPFKLQPSAYEDQARREVLDDDILAPMLRKLQEKNQQRKDEEARKKTQTIEALSDEASKQLKEINGYLIPRPLQPSEQSAYALSALADMSEWIAQQHPSRQYIYMPLAPGDTFPRNALNYGPLPGTSAHMKSPAVTTAGPLQQHHGHPQSHQQQRRPQHTSNVRGRQQQQPGQQQFVFQPPHTQYIYPHPPPQPPLGFGQGQQNHGHRQGQTPARVPVTFVNQTIQSRKASGAAAAAAAGPGGKGQPRMLLPKML